MVKLLIIDSHSLVREALEKRLQTAVGLEVVGSLGCYAEVVQQARVIAPDVILLETKAPEGLETLAILRQSLPDTAVIVLTSYPDSREEDQIRQMGAASYLLKTLDTRSLVREIRTVARPSDIASSAGETVTVSD